MNHFKVYKTFPSSIQSKSFATKVTSNILLNGVISWDVKCETTEDIEELGICLADYLDIQDVILLSGDLGAGKTTFARGIIRCKFGDNNMVVTSPSYLLDNVYQYDEDKYIHHMDLYRLPTGCDLSILGK